MGYAPHAVDNLGPPFLLVDETVFVIPKAGQIRLKKHHFKLIFVLEGQVEHEIEGLEGRQQLVAGDILVAPVVGRHIYINRKRDAVPLHVMRMFLDERFLNMPAAGRFRRPETDLADYILHYFDRVRHIPGGIDNDMLRLIDRFRTETQQRAVGYRHQVRSICLQLLVAVSRSLERGKAERMQTDTGGSRQIVAAAREYILKHYVQPIKLADIAWHVRKGEEHLARLFKQQTGQSVFDHVREMRIQQARTLLQNPALNLTTIATRCGFHSLSFFSRTFRKLTGVSPSRYRRHLGSGEPTISQPEPESIRPEPASTSAQRA
jgi:AraC-like DNA-binding protein